MILIHLEDTPGTGIAACNAQPIARANPPTAAVITDHMNAELCAACVQARANGYFRHPPLLVQAAAYDCTTCHEQGARSAPTRPAARAQGLRPRWLARLRRRPWSTP